MLGPGITGNHSFHQDWGVQAKRKFQLPIAPHQVFETYPKGFFCSNMNPLCHICSELNHHPSFSLTSGSSQCLACILVTNLFWMFSPTWVFHGNTEIFCKFPVRAPQSQKLSCPSTITGAPPLNASMPFCWTDNEHLEIIQIPTKHGVPKEFSLEC